MDKPLIRDEPYRITISSTDIPLLTALWEFLSRFKATEGDPSQIELLDHAAREFLSRFKATEGAETIITLHGDDGPVT